MALWELRHIPLGSLTIYEYSFLRIAKDDLEMKQQRKELLSKYLTKHLYSLVFPAVQPCNQVVFFLYREKSPFLEYSKDLAVPLNLRSFLKLSAYKLSPYLDYKRNDVFHLKTFAFHLILENNPLVWIFQMLFDADQLDSAVGGGGGTHTLFTAVSTFTQKFVSWNGWSSRHPCPPVYQGSGYNKFSPGTLWLKYGADRPRSQLKLLEVRSFALGNNLG